MDKLSADDYANLLLILDRLDQRVSLVEVAVGLEEKTCKVCDTPITIKNASKESLLAELCGECWELQNCEHTDEID